MISLITKVNSEGERVCVYVCVFSRLQNIENDGHNHGLLVMVILRMSLHGF